MDTNAQDREKEIQKLYDFVAEQVIAGLYKSDIIDKLIELGVARDLALELIDEMEQRLTRMRKKRILLVMGDLPEKISLVKELSIAGYKIAESLDEKEGFDKLEGFVPHLIIADNGPPQIDSYSFLKRLRKDPIGRKIPVFIFSERKAMKDSFVVLGLTEFIEKPFCLQEVVKQIKRIIVIPKRSWER